MGDQELSAVHIEINMDKSGRILSQNVYDRMGLLAEIDELMSEGYSAQQIASQLNISEVSVRTYISKLLSGYSPKATKSIYRTVILSHGETRQVRPPFNAEYVLFLLLRKDEREVVVGDLVEGYGQVFRRFNKRRANIWFYKEVCCSLWPLIRRGLLRVGTLVWLGRILRGLIS
jgi:hypothetical protein